MTIINHHAYDVEFKSRDLDGKLKISIEKLNH